MTTNAPSSVTTHPVWGVPVQPPTQPAQNGETTYVPQTQSGPTSSGPIYSGPTYSGPTEPTRRPGDGFFSSIRRLGVVRPDRGRRLAGVCAGLAERWGVSPLAVRVMFVLISMVFGAGLFLYGLLWMLLPHPDGRIHAQQIIHGRITAGFVGALLAILSGVPASDASPDWAPLLLVAVVVAYLIGRRRRTA